MSKKIKKGKLALLALAGSAFVASLLYDKNQKIKRYGKLRIRVTKYRI